MKKQWKKWFVVLVSVLVVAILISCELPFNISITPKTTESPLPPALTPAPGVQDTLPPASLATTAADMILPATGSILRWVDFSDFVYVPSGSFTMGADSTEAVDYAPAHAIDLGGFWIHQAEVTNQQYAQCVANGKCSAPNSEPDEEYRYGIPAYNNYPVVGVTWYQAQEYCTYIDARLPTEAEWEKTARGTEGKLYPWGDDKPTCDLLNYNDCLDPSEPDDVRSYNNGTSPFEAMDMSGNVFEWVSDWYQSDYYAVSPSSNPPGPGEGKKKVYRGGSYKTPEDEILPVLRYSLEPEKHAADIGFRCVLLGEDGEIPTPPAPPCEVVALNSEPDGGPTPTPIGCSDPTITAYCEIRPNGASASGVRIDEVECGAGRLDANGFTQNGNPLICSLPGAGQFRWFCNDPSWAQGLAIKIGYCHEYYPIQLVLECPTGYQYNSASTFCEPEGAWLPDPPCPMGYVEVEGFGCLPDYWASGHGCPVGFYTVYFGSTALCIPLDECLLPNAPESCNPPVCPEGETYDTARQCCVQPENPRQVCPVGWTYYEAKNVCIKPQIFANPCGAQMVKIPLCPTRTPTQPPSYDPCRQFTRYDQCLRNQIYQCYWTQPNNIQTGDYCRSK